MGSRPDTGGDSIPPSAEVPFEGVGFNLNICASESVNRVFLRSLKSRVDDSKKPYSFS